MVLDGIRPGRSGRAFITLGLLALGLVTVLLSCSDDQGKAGPAPVRVPAATLTTRLALVSLHGIAPEALADARFLPAWRECAERGCSGKTAAPLDADRFELFGSGHSLLNLIGRNDLRAINYGPEIRREGVNDIPWTSQERFDETVFSALDRESWKLFLARLEVAHPGGQTTLFGENGQSPSAYGFAVSAIDHELRRLVYQVGSHLTLVTLCPQEGGCHWTISGPGHDHPEVIEALEAGAIGNALGRLLGFEALSR